MNIKKNRIGDKYGYLKVIAEAPSYYKNGRMIDTQWVCKCDCGEICIKKTHYLKTSLIPNCGCKQRRIQYGSRLSYTEAQEKFLIDHYYDGNWEDIEQIFPGKTHTQISQIANRLGLQRIKPSNNPSRRTYSNSQLQWLQNNYDSVSYSDIMDHFPSHSWQQIQRIAKSRGIELKQKYNNKFQNLKEYQQKIGIKAKGINKIYSRYRASARERGYSFNISKELFSYLIEQPCYYCGTKPKNKYTDSGYPNEFYYHNGIDRINNEIGYEDDNVIPCCTDCNVAKGTKTQLEFYTWVQKCSSHFKVS